jgi:type I restriction enzyme, S subunit
MISALTPYPAYKDSGVPELGRVPTHWETKPLSALGSFFKGKGGSKDDEVPSGVPCVRYGDLYTQHEFFVHKTRAFIGSDRLRSYTPIKFGDVLFAGSGETIEDIGRSAVVLIRDEARCGGDVIGFRPNGEFAPRFLGYACDSAAAKAQKARMGRGFTIVHIYPNELKRLALVVPSAAEQTSIARYLDHIDRRIRRYIGAKQKMIALLNEQKQAVIQRVATRGLDRNARLEASGIEWLGDVPELWKIKSVGEIASFISYGFTNPMPASEVGPYMLTAADIGDGRIRYGQARHTTQDAFDRLLTKKSRPICGDILLTKDGTLGRAAICDGTSACINQSVALLRVKSEEVLPEFFLAAIRSSIYQQKMLLDAGGTTIKHIYITRLAKMKMAYPPIDNQLAIVSLLNKSLARLQRATDKIEQQIRLLGQYRTCLIADVVTGKLDVREAAARLPEETEDAEETEVVEPLDRVDDDKLDAQAEKVES